MDRHHWLRRIEELDPVADAVEIYGISATHEFPWDYNQSLSFALFRTYAVPSIGRLLAETGEFTERVQKRYDDTTLILDAVLEHGHASPQGRSAIRRMNQMHGAYDISNADFLYVLATFVVVPIRWIDDMGWRRLSEHERIAAAHNYRELGKLMGMKDIPETHREFATYMDDYEREHFGYDPGARAVADATLGLFATFPPNHLAPEKVVTRFSYGLMDDALRDAFRYPRIPAWEQRAARAAVRARSAVVRRMRPREEPRFARELPNVRSYPDGYDVSTLGTFPRGCPVPHGPS
ncbi:oxygenase MpaB family protein [Pseudonocardia abyssalis]|uniref:DUF2236 domain-containing protein n=1 Tax=Pseudonocardia abyssalis TaxID=2792008 RepID=A0ABS6UKR9_9PSEU|nr:oxygenase MpaB family protein [Pseudonocardia abyssalis]MBW0117112.1 DUF2236 domain-containing protein [Pseudonocardia abyssalis]MBW0132862.1 DUF2236 domain-containing protein [Pseudonocardia abyssalis]